MTRISKPNGVSSQAIVADSLAPSGRHRFLNKVNGGIVPSFSCLFGTGLSGPELYIPEVGLSAGVVFLESDKFVFADSPEQLTA